MKILFVGDFNLVLLPNLISELSKTPGNTFTLLGALSGRIYPVSELNVYSKTHYPKNRNKKRILFGINLLRSFWKLVFMKPVDIINIHYVNPYYLLFLPLFKWKAASLVLNLYGTDFYLARRKTRWAQYFIFKATDQFLFSNPQMAKDFILEFPAFSEKVSICSFGLKLLPKIHTFGNAKDSAKRKFQFPTEKIIISCGHSAHIRERHIDIIKQLTKLPDSQKRKIFLVFPFTYNVTPEFIHTISDAMKDSNISYHIISDFLEEDEIAAFRVACDVLISVPSSDQMTASMLETLYAGGVVITGTWLPYSFLDENRTSYIKISTLNELPETLDKVIHTLSSGKSVIQAHRNKSIIERHFSWEYCRKNWLTLFSASKK